MPNREFLPNFEVNTPKISLIYFTMMRNVAKIFVLCLFLFPFALNAQDWANLGRFAAENSALGAPAKGEKRVVFMGNSITEQWLATHPQFFSEGRICRGISGQTTPQMLVRFRQDVIALHPKAVVILGGINDIAGNTGPESLETIEGNIASMAELAQANHIKVVLCTLLPANRIPWRSEIKPADKVIALNKWIESFARARGFAFVDYYSPLVNDEKGIKQELTRDGVHCTPAGYDIMEAIIQKTLKKVLK